MRDRTEKQINASRINGAQSHGPVTEEGKRRSSQNSLKHGILAKCVVLNGESTVAFDNFCERFASQIDPKNALESSLVQELVNAKWRMRRSWTIETGIFNREISQQMEGDTSNRVVEGAIQAVSKPEFSSAMRYQTQLERAAQRALSSLLQLRGGKLAVKDSSPEVEQVIEDVEVLVEEDFPDAA